MDDLVLEFEINNNKYKIFLKEAIANEDDAEYTFGMTYFITNEIHIRKDLPKSSIIRVLKHELMHVWLYETGHNVLGERKKFTDEDICEIVACSNDWLNEVVERYKNVTKN